MPLLDEVSTYLQSQGVGTVNRDLFLGLRPAEPPECLTLAEYAGNAMTYVQERADPLYESPQLQVIARSADYMRARTLAKSAWSVLARLTNSILSGTRYLSIRPNSSPALIGRDQNGLILIGFNCTVEKEVS